MGNPITVSKVDTVIVKKNVPYNPNSEYCKDSLHYADTSKYIMNTGMNKDNNILLRLEPKNNKNILLFNQYDLNGAPEKQTFFYTPSGCSQTRTPSKIVDRNAKDKVIRVINIDDDDR